MMWVAVCCLVFLYSLNETISVFLRGRAAILQCNSQPKYQNFISYGNPETVNTIGPLGLDQTLGRSLHG